LLTQYLKQTEKTGKLVAPIGMSFIYFYIEFYHNFMSTFLFYKYWKFVDNLFLTHPNRLNYTEDKVISAKCFT